MVTLGAAVRSCVDEPRNTPALRSDAEPARTDRFCVSGLVRMLTGETAAGADAAKVFAMLNELLLLSCNGDSFNGGLPSA